VVTDRYAHLRPDLYRDEDYRVLSVDLNTGCGKVLPMKPQSAKSTIGYAVATQDTETPDRAIVSG
jgi:hypothetical protein